MHSFSDLALVGIMTVGGLFFGKATKRVRLPSIVGYMVLGVLLGASAFNVFRESFVHHSEFLNHIILGLVAFSIGCELSIKALRRFGMGIVLVIVLESFVAFLLVTVAVYLYSGDAALSLLFGAMAPASAPAGTVAVIQEYRSRGNLTQILYAVVGFDDGLAIIIYGFAAAIAKAILIAQDGGAATGVLAGLGKPLLEITLSVLLGLTAGGVFFFLHRYLSRDEEVLGLIFGTVLLVTGCSIQHHLSLIMANMTVGILLANLMSNKQIHRLMTPLRLVMPMLFIWFFCLAGAHLDLLKLPQLGVLGLIYILTRSLGKILGAYGGATLGNIEPRLRKWIGPGILSQAGVAIGLSLLIKSELDAMGTPHAAALGASIITTITATCIFFEVIGPICAKWALDKAGEIPTATAPEPTTSAAH